MVCSHESCKCDEKIWFPTDNNRWSDVDLHYWCIHCGLIKNISDDRPKKIGYWMNILSKLSNTFSITQCQKRLVSKELHSCEEFSDIYGLTCSAQKEFFVKILRRYCNIHDNIINSFIY